MAHAQKPDFVFRRNGRVHLNQRRRQFNRLLAAEVCASAVVMLDIPCSEVVWRVLATHSIRQFPLHFPSRATPCAITYQLNSTSLWCRNGSVMKMTGVWHVIPCSLVDIVIQGYIFWFDSMGGGSLRAKVAEKTYRSCQRHRSINFPLVTICNVFSL